MSIKIGLRYDGNGRFYTLSRHDHEIAQEQLRQGDVFNAELTRPRSVSQTRAFHALMEEAFDNQSAGPSFETWRHLKAWVLIQLGHCEKWTFAPGSMTAEVANVLRQKFDFVDVARNSKGEIILRFAKSVAHNEVDADKMTKLFDGAISVIAREIMPGMDEEELRQHCTTMKSVAQISRVAITGEVCSGPPS